MVASVAVRLPANFFATMGEIMNSDHTDLCQSETTFSSICFLTDPTSQQLKDSLVYRNMLKLHSIYYSSSFMKSKLEADIESQINTTHRLKYICKNGFKTFHSVVVCEQFRLAKLALDDIVKFKTYLREQGWPENMDPIKLSMQRTTMFDSEPSSNNDNEFTILPSTRYLLSKLNIRLVEKFDHQRRLWNDS